MLRCFLQPTTLQMREDLFHDHRYPKVPEYFTITTTRAFSWLKADTTTLTLKTLLRHYAKRVLTPWSLNMKLDPRRNYHKGRAAIRHYANQTARSL